jgi:hypothetical protein
VYTKLTISSTGAATFSGNVGIGNPSVIEGVLTIQGTSASYVALLQILITISRSLGNQLNMVNKLMENGSYIQSSDSNSSTLSYSSKRWQCGYWNYYCPILSKLNVNNASSGAITRGLGLYNVFNAVAGTGVSLDQY